MVLTSIPTTFSIDFVGELTKVNDLISQVKARIYYKGGNRNGTWITDDFAEKLNQTLPHVPIVATYNQETEDFEDHVDKTNKKAYGFVPSNPNAHWEKDFTGKETLVADVYLWTGYWPEAAKIVNKSQSMELNKESITGDFKVVGGDYYFVYQNASFKGLCALGDTVVPCFENSRFFSLDEESRSFFQSLEEISEKKLEGGNIEMEDILKDTPEEIEVITEPAKVVEEVITIEPEVVEDTLEKEEVVVEKEEIVFVDLVPIVDEPAIDYQEIINGLNTDVLAYQTQITDLTNQLTSKQVEIDELGQYKVRFIKEQKQSIIEQFKKKLSEEEISPFIDTIDDYSTEELKTKLSIVLADKMLQNDAGEVQPQSQFVSVPTNEKESGLVSILKLHKK